MVLMNRFAGSSGDTDKENTLRDKGWWGVGGEDGMNGESSIET